MKKYFIFFFLLFTVIKLFSQNKLQLTYERFGKVKVYELYNGDVLDYKLKGKLFYDKQRIAAMNDSLIVLKNDSVLKLRNIKKLRFVSANHFAKTIQDALIISGGGFVLLNTVNNAINGVSPAIDPVAVYISAGLLSAGLIVKALRTKHIRINKNKTFRVVEANYENMNGTK